MKTIGEHVVLLLLSLSIASGCQDAWPGCANIKHFCNSPTTPWVKESCKISCGVCFDVGQRNILLPPPAGWSACTKTCGEGTRYTLSTPRKYEACNIQACTQSPCTGAVRRKEIPHACCTSDTSTSCGKPDVGGRIIGGTDTEIKYYPWMAIIKSTVKFCAAVIISDRWLLSAGHCFRNSQTRINYYFSSWKIYVGMSSAYTVYISQLEQLIPLANKKAIEKVVFHPDHLYPIADIVLIKVTTKIAFTDRVKSVCLPAGENTPTDTKCFVTGWGVSNLQSPAITNILQEVPVSNFKQDICTQGYKGSSIASYLATDTRWLCAGNLHSLKDACTGDSGGALVCQRCTSCSYYVAGIVSFGNKHCNDTSTPGIYTRVRDYENWIAQETSMWWPSGKFCSQTVGP